MPTRNKIVLVGAGNVATQLGKSLKEKGFHILQVYSYTIESAEKLGKILHSDYTSQINAINPNADIYIFSVKDSALSDLLKQIKINRGLCVHTAGSLPMSVFQTGNIQEYGVFYPLQTFSKTRDISFQKIPIFIEANNPKNEDLLCELASSISEKVIVLSSEKRKYLHLAAVFACNFTNHLYANASEILEQEGLSKEFLLPLIDETANKIHDLTPREAQTGPAVRYDKNVIDKHLDLLKDNPETRNLYEVLSESIYRKSEKLKVKN